MKTYQQFAKRLQELLGNAKAVRITVDGFMPLSVEEILPTGEGHRQISLAHYGKQNGDLMRDPEIIFEVYDWGQDGPFAEPVYFRNDYAGLEQFVYDTDVQGKKLRIRPQIKHELRSFARLWFRNLRAQGFFDADAEREVLS